MRRSQNTKKRALLSGLAFIVICILTGVGTYHVYKPLPTGLSFAGPQRQVNLIGFYRDLTWVDSEGERQTHQEIFDRIIDMINGASRFIVLDMFLFNDFIGMEQTPYRRLAEELTAALVAGKEKHPSMQVVVITDPINTVYDGMASPYFERMTAAGIDVIFTRLEKLRDSNPAYSVFWRLFIKPFGNSRGSLLPNPFGRGNVSLRSYLTMLNFKANHRKLIICDRDEGYGALVTSANPHDGSAAHGNVAIFFNERAVSDLLYSEKAVLDFSGGPELSADIAAGSGNTGNAGMRVQIITESRIKMALLDAISKSGRGDSLDIVVFYLSDRDIIEALKNAADRGAAIRVLLDPNKDAFGREKNGVPNRPVAAELVKAGIAVRWSNTHGEQSHAKMLLAKYNNGQSILILGSANFTRRNLDDFNLETDVAVLGSQNEVIFSDAGEYFDLLWRNPDGRKFSVGYREYADESLAAYLLYRWMETTGMSTF